MKTKEEIIEELNQILLNDKFVGQRLRDDQIKDILDLFSQQKQEMVRKGYKQAIQDLENMDGEPLDDRIAGLYNNLERLNKPNQTKTD